MYVIGHTNDSLIKDPFNLGLNQGPRGTKAKPTLVPSMFEERIVGCICKYSVMWLLDNLIMWLFDYPLFKLSIYSSHLCIHLFNLLLFHVSIHFHVELFIHPFMSYICPSVFQAFIFSIHCSSGEPDATYITWMNLKKGPAQRCECGQWYQLIEANPMKV